MLIVMKFGGSSLADRERVQNAARRIAAERELGNSVAVVVSAQGNTTDLLLDKALELNPAPPERELDALLSAGEQVSAALMAMTLEEMGIRAVSLTAHQAGLLTDGVYGNARVRELTGDRLRRELEAGRVAVVAGFQGIGPDGDTVTLGRGGSDTTAVALAAWLGAGECRIYTDVDGVYDRDPRRFQDAVRLERVDYRRMLTMARQGAQVLHDRCVELGQRYRVPIRVLSSFSDGNGSLVTEDEE